MHKNTVLTDKSIDIIVALQGAVEPIEGTRSIIEKALTLYQSTKQKKPRKVKVTKEKAPYVDPRTAEYLALYNGGMTLQEIGDQVGLTRERVRMIMKRSPDYHKHPGKIKLSEEQKARIKDEKNLASFWALIDKSGGPEACWLWLGTINGTGGYGTFGPFRQKHGYVHRTAYILTNGKIPKGTYICHSCNNPRCCNPVHLYAGSQRQNMQDREKRYDRGEIVRVFRGSRTVSPDTVSKIEEHARSGMSALQIFKTGIASYPTVQRYIKIARQENRL